MSFLLGLVGFILYFIYDLNQIYNFHKLIKMAFSLGSLFILVGTILALDFEIKNYLGLLLSLLGIILEIYVLFFALNFKDTYVNDDFKVCDKGVYALCRHPGFYSFLLIYVGLAIVFQTDKCIYMGLMYNILNLLYILFQDIFVFPRLFNGYGAYKMTTPCLLFNRRSIKKCVNDFRGI